MQTDFEGVVETKKTGRAGATAAATAVATAVASSPRPVEPVGKDADGVPYCVLHHCRMEQVSGGRAGDGMTYLRCPVDGCGEKGKKIRTTQPKLVPSAPLTCSACERGGELVFLERDPKASTHQFTVLHCPRCGRSLPAVARPEFADADARGRAMAARRNAAEIGGR